MKLDFSPFRKAVASLNQAVDRSLREPNDEVIRDAVIQRFKYTYELAWKMMKRALEQEVPNPAAIDQLSFRDLLREAAERGMIPSVRPWIEYRNQRNITTHTYDEKKARSVYATVLRFAADVGRFLETLKKSAEMIKLDSGDLQVVQQILKKLVGQYQVLAFGSRVSGKNLKRFSDLDLAVMTDQPLPAAKFAELVEAFSQSDLPIKVDLVDWASISKRFRKIIQETHEVIQPGRQKIRG